MEYCSSCLAPSTRPRITFNDSGICNACQHAENKKTVMDWGLKKKELTAICDRFRRQDGSFDCIAPCSGGKDGSYVAWKLKHDLGMHPLCVTLTPQLPTEIGKQNLQRFKDSGFDHLQITADPLKEKKIAKYGFVTQGQPKLSAMIGQTTALVNLAIKFNISLLVWGEEGESEYGGVTYMSKKSYFTRQERIRIYFENNDPDEVAKKASLTLKDMVWWAFPNEEKLRKMDITCIFWSHFEDWNPYEHYLFAKKHCGFQALPSRNIGTYTNFAQLDDDMQDLHAYLMFIKFAFGRATSDACIDVRRGALDRKQALALVGRYDGEYPEPLISQYLDYFEMTKKEFDAVLDRLANKEELKKANGIWVKKYPAC